MYPDAYTFFFFSLKPRTSTCLELSEECIKGHLLKESVIKTFRKHLRSSKFAWIKSSPRYLEIPVLDFGATSYSRRQAPKLYVAYRNANSKVRLRADTMIFLQWLLLVVRVQYSDFVSLSWFKSFNLQYMFFPMIKMVHELTALYRCFLRPSILDL